MSGVKHCNLKLLQCCGNVTKTEVQKPYKSVSLATM